MSGDNYYPLPTVRHLIVQSKPSKIGGHRDEVIVSGYESLEQAQVWIESANSCAAEGTFFYIKTKEQTQ